MNRSVFRRQGGLVVGWSQAPIVSGSNFTNLHFPSARLTRALSRLENHIRFKIRHLLILVTLIAIIVAYCTTLIGNSEREYSSYQQLCDLGAVGDDWVSYKELITGRPPIVQIDIPRETPKQLALQLLPNLNNLESLSIEYDSLTNDDLDALQRLGLRSLEFAGEFPGDLDVQRLSRLRHLKFLYIPANQLSPSYLHRLRVLLPSTKIDAR